MTLNSRDILHLKLTACDPIHCKKTLFSSINILSPVIFILVAIPLWAYPQSSAYNISFRTRDNHSEHFFWNGNKLWKAYQFPISGNSKYPSQTSSVRGSYQISLWIINIYFKSAFIVCLMVKGTTFYKLAFHLWKVLWFKKKHSHFNWTCSDFNSICLRLYSKVTSSWHFSLSLIYQH